MKLPVAILISLYVFALPTSHAQTNAARTGVSPTASAQDSHLISITRSSLFGTRSFTRDRRKRHIPNRSPDGVAYTPTRSNPDRDSRSRLGCAMGRSGPRDSRRRRRLDSGRSETLAWSDSEYSNDSYRNIGRAQRQQWRVVGKGKRRTIQEVSLIHVLKRGV